MTVKSTKLGPGTLSLGDTGSATEFGGQVTNMRITNSVDEEDNIPVLSGEELAGDETYGFELAGTLIQDYETGNLLEWCHENRGKEVPFTFVPNTEAARAIRGRVKVRPVDIGGDVKKTNTSDFTFKGVGDYSFSDVGA